jgi:hypothetical protein
MNPRRRVRCMLLGLLGFLLAAAAVNRIVDPYDAWPPNVVGDAYRSDAEFGDDPYASGADRVTTAFRLETVQPRVLLLGSSNVLIGMYVAHREHGAFFNAAQIGATIDELATLLRVAIDHHRPEVIVWGLDFYAADARVSGFRFAAEGARLQAYTGPTSFWRLQRARYTLLSLNALDASRRVLLRALLRRRRLDPEVPWPEGTIRKQLEKFRDTRLPDSSTLPRREAMWHDLYRTIEPSPEILHTLGEAVARAEKAGSRLIFVIPPTSRIHLRALDGAREWKKFQAWKRRLGAIIGPYWDLSGYNDLGCSDHFFVDFLHMRPVTGQVVLRRLLGLGCEECGDLARVVEGAMAYVAPESIDRHLARQDDERRLRRRGCVAPPPPEAGDGGRS